MGYAENLMALLKPLGVYAADGVWSAGEIYALGAALDGVDGVTGILDRECTLGTAESYGLELYEEILPNKPVTMGLEQRRHAIEALLSIDGMSFTPERLNATLAGCGLPAQVAETGEHYKVEVTFPENRGIPPEIDSIMSRIEEILPCHLDVVYRYIYCTWGELEQSFDTWGDIMDSGALWSDLESFIPGTDT